MSIYHAELGLLSPERTTIDPFRPERWLACPGNLRKLQRVAARKWRADMGEYYYSIPRKLRSAAREMAVDAAVCRFLDAPYGELGITDDEPARAVLVAIAYVRRARWRVGNEGASRADWRRIEPHIGSMASRGDNPAAVAAAINAARGWRRFDTPLQADVFENAARYALTGGGTETPTGDTVHCPGGNGYNVTREMVATERVSCYLPGEGRQDWDGPDGPVSIPFRYRHVEYDGGWRMIETRQTKPQKYPAGDAMVTRDQ
jgi:hypothetical protein